MLGKAGINNYRLYSGDSILIYTDICNSGYLDTANEEHINKLEDYKKPYYDKGSWNLNYFRNRINKDVNEAELNSYTSILYYNKASRSTEEAKISINKLNAVYNYDSDKNKADASDNRSLIYGKYFVIRFVFNHYRRVKLETIDVNVNQY